jgi:hypothetical protein
VTLGQRVGIEAERRERTRPVGVDKDVGAVEKFMEPVEASGVRASRSVLRFPGSPS